MSFERFKAELVELNATFEADRELLSSLADDLERAGCFNELAEGLLRRFNGEKDALEWIDHVGQHLQRAVRMWEQEVRLIAVRRRLEARRLGRQRSA